MNNRPTNPFYNTGSIKDPELFFNRKNDIEIILNVIFSERPQCLSIIGQRKIGKSSLVHYVSLPLAIQRFNYAPSNIIFIFFDCQKRFHSLKNSISFYQELLDCLRETLPPEVERLTFSIETEGSYIGEELEKAFKALDKIGITVILILDEFEKAVFQESLIKEGFFGSLRGYTQANKNFSWITCTSRPLHQLFEEAFDEFKITPARRKSESDFYNIAPPHSIGLFELNETENLIVTPSQKQGIVFSEDEKRLVRKIAGNFPYFVQRCCYHLFNYHLQEDGYNTLLEQCHREFIPLWEDYWNKLDSDQKKALSIIAHGDYTNVAAPLVEALKDAALIYEEGAALHPFSEEFGHFIGSKQKDVDVLNSPDVGKLLLDISALNLKVENERQRCLSLERDLRTETQKLLNETGTNKLLNKRLKRYSFYVRLLVSLLFSVYGFGALFLAPRIWNWKWLSQHPRRIGLHICSVILILGIAWMIVDAKRRLVILLSVIVVAILIIAQIS